uniref:Zinc finger protein unc-98 n=1 Tax=Meloidogyne javanica TaxID=6303 RepID=A0A915LJ22_MELJA
MLRRLLSSPLSMNGKVDEDLYGAGDEPKEYFLLSKMQPLPPEDFDQNDLQNYYQQQPNFGNNQQQHQQGFSTVAIENDVYWPNFIPLDQCNNGNASNIITINSTSLPPPTHPPQPLFYSTPLHIPSTKNILEEKNFQNDDNCIKNNFVFESTQDGMKFKPDFETIRKMSTTSYNGYGIERNGESPLLDCDSTDVFYCHYCSRSFPRSRISPTRHVAQCRRLNTNEDGGGGSSSSCSGSNTQQRQNTPTTTIDFSSLINANSCSSPAPGGIGSVDPTDPYQCSWCQFNTLYKGNMKRHLICCHQVSLESLTNLNFNIERLRRLSTTRPELDELPILPRRDGKEANNLENVTASQQQQGQQNYASKEDEQQQTTKKNCVKDENGFTYYKCRFCGLTFNFMTTLKAHERVHDIIQPYTCNKCGEAFHYMCELEYHAKTHLTQKGYKCECGRTFFQYTDLLNHRHPGEDPPEPAIPPIPSLVETLPQLISSATLKAEREMELPTPDFKEKGFEPKYQNRVWTDIRSKPYICQYCSKSYSDSRQLAYHMYSHRGERAFNPRASRYLMCRNENSYISSGIDLKDA